MFCAGKAAAPLATGNTVVMKPPEQAPLSSLRLAELIGAFCPPVFSTSCPAAAKPARRTRHQDVAAIALIGYVPTGRAVMKAAADTLKPVMLELGGKNALIAYPDADPDDVAGGVVGGMNFTWCGQSCGSTGRAFVHEEIYDAVLEKVESQDRPLQAGHRHRSYPPPWDRSSPKRNTTASSALSSGQAGRRAAYSSAAASRPIRRWPKASSSSRRVRRRAAEHAHRARGDFRTGAQSSNGRTKRKCSNRSIRSNTA